MKKKDKKLLLWGAAAAAALYFLTRPKASSQPTKAPGYATIPPIAKDKTSASVARVGLPYTYNAEV